MTQAKPKKLACGGVGPCCHIGYAHRHCEHCDQVIALTQPYVYSRPVWNPIYTTPYGTFNIDNVAAAPAGMNFLNVQHGNTGDFAKALEASWKSTTNDGTDTAPVLSPTTAHTCEVK